MQRPWIAAVTLAFCFAFALAEPPMDPHAAAVANLRSLGMGCLLYAAENKGYLPETPSQILKYESKPEVFLDPRIPTLAPNDDPTKMDESAKAEWINRSCAFGFAVLPGTKMSKIRRPNSTPMLVSRVDESSGELLICFADGHVEAFGPKPLPHVARVNRPSTRPPATNPAATQRSATQASSTQPAATQPQR